ncbi:MAG TPA: hypothetical protein PL041_04075 [Melioribacteraceae bacterium]|nr:hypothetical protein [Melioribacteraceae bacterium]
MNLPDFIKEIKEVNPLSEQQKIADELKTKAAELNKLAKNAAAKGVSVYFYSGIGCNEISLSLSIKIDL